MLIIAREQTYADSLRAYSIWFDGNNIGGIRSGEIKQFDISPGFHKLVLKIDWAKSQEISFIAADGQDVYFQCSSSVNGTNLFIRGLQALYYASLGIGKYITLLQVAHLRQDQLLRNDPVSRLPSIEPKGITAFKLFYYSLICLGVVMILSSIVGSDYNPLTHTCVSNPSPQDRGFVAGSIAFGEEYTNPPQRFCNDNFHPQFTETWETIDRYVLYTAYAITIPLIVTSGSVLVYRNINKTVARNRR